MLGFGSLGQFSLGEFQQTQRAAFSDFSVTAGKRCGLAVAVIATTFAGFVSPPSAQASSQPMQAFTKFSEPARKAVVQPAWLATPFSPSPAPAVFSRFDQPARRSATQSGAWLQAPFVAPAVPGIFSQFSQPLISRAVIADEQPSALFDTMPPATVAFAGFFSFDVPQFARPKAFDQSVQFTAFVAPIIDHGGGGDDRHLRDQRVRKRTGFEPVRKLPPQKTVHVKQPVPLPPFQPRPEPAQPDSSPFDLVDRDLIHEDLLALQDQIRTAQDIADIQRYLRGIDQDEQDAADIADVLAILDLE